MAAPATYIRTLQSSLTSAHPHSTGAWAASATASAQYHLNHHTITSNPNTPRHPVNYSHSPTFNHNHPPSISTHNAHMYTHHLRDLTHPAPANHRAAGAQGPTQHSFGMTQQGAYIPASTAHQHQPAVTRRSPPSPPPNRRRSSSIRMPPSYKFDPFGDDPVLPVPSLSMTSSGGAASPALGASAISQSAPELVPAASEPEVDISSAAAQIHSQPYTIQIPAAAPNDIQRYTPPRAPTPAARTLSPSFRSGGYSAPVSVPKLAPNSSALGLTAPISTSASSSTGTYSQSNPFPAPNLSKIVAGMMLNRVHSPKPTRRRIISPGGRQYVKSCLSSVVSVEV